MMRDPALAEDGAFRWNRVLRRLDSQLWRIASDPKKLAIAAPLSVLGGIFLFTGLRGLNLLALNSSNGSLRFTAIALGLVIACMTLVPLYRTYRNVHIQPQAWPAFGILLIISVAVTLAVIEVFAGFIALRWTGRAFGSHNVSLWRTEQLFVWHLLDAIPVLDIPTTLSWAAPSFDPRIRIGILVVIFKIILIIPLLEMARAAYRVATENRLTRRVGAWSVGRRLTAENPTDIRRGLFALTLLSALSYVLLLGALGPESWVQRHAQAVVPRILYEVSMIEMIPRSWGLGDVVVDAQVITVAISVIVTLILIWWFVLAMGAILLVQEEDSALGSAGSALAYLLTFGITLATVTATAVTLFAVGVVDVGSSNASVVAVLQWFGWRIADAIPLLGIPDSFGWELGYGYSDGRFLALLLAAKIAYALFLVVLLGDAVRTLMRWTGWTRAEPNGPEHSSTPSTSG